MTKSIFIFIASLFLIVPLILWYGEMDLQEQAYLCVPLILLFGIPHGAIDNVLYLRYKKLKLPVFIAFYLTLVAFYVTVWIYFPAIAYLSFLILSAYHFGQSQLIHYFKIGSVFLNLVYFFWGILLISSLIYFNQTEIQSILLNSYDLKLLVPIHTEVLAFYVFIVSLSVLFISFLILFLKKDLNAEAIAMETIVIGLILIAFYLLPIFVGFTFYFIILHSLKVMREEYHYLSAKNIVRTPLNFLKLLAPLSVLSYLGMALLFFLIYMNVFSIGYGYMFLIVISSITFPHIFVMEKFYKLLSLRQ